MFIKRDSQKETLDITKIQKMTIEATADLDAISQSELEIDAQIQFIDGLNFKNAFVEYAIDILIKEKEKLKEKQKRLYNQIIENLRQIKLIKSQIINLITFTFNNNYFNVYLFNIIGNNSSEKPNN
jgi:hypothetical protein